MIKSCCSRIFVHGAALIFCACIFFGCLDPFRAKVAEGNREYHAQNYEQAQKKYDEAEQYAIGEEAKKRLIFNKGTARYMADDYEGALELYKNAVDTKDKEVQKRSFFNMGNVYLKMDKKREAFESYANALKVDSAYEAPKKNIEYLLHNKNEDDKKQNNDKDDKDAKGDDDENKNGQEPQNNKNDNLVRQEMSQEQVKNLLDAMKTRPVERSKGKNGRRSFEKDW